MLSSPERFLKPMTHRRVARPFPTTVRVERNGVKSKEKRPGSYTLRLRACALRSARTGFCIGLLALFLSGVAEESAAQAQLDPDVAAFVDEMVSKHQFRRAELQRLFARVQPRPSIIRAMTTPGTARPWHEFRGLYVNRIRIEGGVKFWRLHADAMERASREYGVPEELIVATIGIETHYGRNMGNFKVLEALAMLAFQYPPRAEFFRRELEEYLLLARESGFDPLAVKGSYAGAIGIPQFLPSSYRAYAVDFDRDGIRDLAGTPADAIGSVANYYRQYGWRVGEAVVVPVEANESSVDTVKIADIKPQTPVGELRRRGVVPLAAVPDDAEAALFVLETDTGPRYWLGLNNFYVITRYNRSVNYAMAVIELAAEIKSAMTQRR
jgi:membrane-bound lytic murein transglycosylase B